MPVEQNEGLVYATKEMTRTQKWTEVKRREQRDESKGTSMVKRRISYLTLPSAYIHASTVISQQRQILLTSSRTLVDEASAHSAITGSRS